LLKNLSVPARDAQIILGPLPAGHNPGDLHPREPPGPPRSPWPDQRSAGP
jgi:hypothetical protein